jgi:hypothetical protein
MKSAGASAVGHYRPHGLPTDWALESAETENSDVFDYVDAAHKQLPDLFAI